MKDKLMVVGMVMSLVGMKVGEMVNLSRGFRHGVVQLGIKI